MSDSSPGVEIESDPLEVSASSDSTEASSPRDGGETLIDSVSEALKDSEAEKSPSSSTGAVDETASQRQPSAEDPLGEITDQELARYGPKTQRRIKQLLAARTELSSEVEGLRVKAQSFEKIDEYIRTNRLTNDDFAVLLEIGSLVRNDPFEAFKRFSAITAELAKVTGHELPPELAERVKLGYLAEQDAREIVQNRNRAALAEQRAQESRQQSQEDQTRQQVQSHVQTCRQTANTWESQRKSTDPDWNEKQGRISELIELEVYRNGYPQTQRAVVEMLDGFLKQVNGELARFKPPPREVRPTLGAYAQRPGYAEPKTLMEAIDAALAK